MRLSLANKISAAVAGVIALAVLSSMAALLSSWHIGNLMERMVSENLPSVRAAEELEISLLEQRGFVSSYIHDRGNREWLLELSRKKQGFHTWLNRARQSAHTQEERDLLVQLDQVYQEYDAKRDEVVRLYDRGEVERATRLLLREVNQLYNQAYELCESFILANEQYVDSVAARANQQTRRVTWMVGVSVVMTVVLGAALLWLFFYGVLFPLRRMVADARGFTGEAVREDTGLPTDELRAVGLYLRNLMSDVADTRSTLEESRRQLRDSEKLASVGKLAASVAHEIRDPLTSLKIWLYSIRKEVGSDPELDRKFEVVAGEVGRLESIVRNFLEFSRPPELKLQTEPVSAILDKTLELVGPRMTERGIKLLRRDGPDLPPVLADREQLKQVLINLLVNAADAVGEGGEIRMLTAAEPDSDGRKAVVVRVADTGPGMPDEVCQRIFEPFFTTKESGTGLGLSIAARIVARHGGRLVLESSTEQGTTFAIHLPPAQGEKT